MQNLIMTRWIGSSTLVLALAACGGSDGGSTNSQTVPTAATSSLGTDTASAKSVVSFLVNVDDQAVQSDGEFKQINNLGSSVGIPTGSAGVTAKSTKQIQQSVACAEFFEVGSSLGGGSVTSCTGTINASTNFDEYENASNGVLPAGAFATVSFSGVTVQTSAGPVTIGGSMTLTVLEAWNVGELNGSAGGAFRLSFNGLTGIDDEGQPFGPETGSIDASIDANGVSYVVNGTRISGLNVTDTGDEDTYTIASGSVITNYEGGHAKVDFQNWNVIDGIPQPGSSVTVTGANGSATATVQSISGNQISFQVVINADGLTETHPIDGTINGAQIEVS